MRNSINIIIVSLFIAFLLFNSCGVDEKGINSPSSNLNGPLAEDFYPTNNKIDVDIDTYIEITFDKEVQGGLGNITLYKYNDNTEIEVVDATSSNVYYIENVARIFFNSYLDTCTKYYILIDSGAINDKSIVSKAYKGISDKTQWTFTTNNSIIGLPEPKIIAYYPDNHETNVSQNTSINITFDQQVKAGTGFIKIYDKNADTLCYSYGSNSSQIIYSNSTITIKPSTVLDTLVTYTITIDSGAVIGMPPGNRAFEGILDKSTWSFTTTSYSTDKKGPKLISFKPTNNSMNVWSTDFLILNFNKEVQSGNGRLLIYKASGNKLYQVLKSTENITYNGTQAIATPPTSLEFGTIYYVLADSNVISDNSQNKNAWIGIDDANYWRFTTDANFFSYQNVANAKFSNAIDLDFSSFAYDVVYTPVFNQTNTQKSIYAKMFINTNEYYELYITYIDDNSGQTQFQLSSDNANYLRVYKDGKEEKFIKNITGIIKLTSNKDIYIKGEFNLTATSDLNYNRTINISGSFECSND